ncbi:MAG: nucleoside:proton symporter [Nitrospinota bacterium]|nr:nucleoside:proton symporter [Nitrospinota bacterium]MDH5755165.1 nucleoside:proton symporter [Nitrospinota bacterium]
MLIAQSIFGFFALAAIAWAVSENRAAVSGRHAAIGFGAQIILALILFKAPGARELFLALNNVALALEASTRQATSFVFGYAGGGPAPFEATAPHNGFILAFQALPLILVVSALSALLFHWGVLPVLVRGFAWALQKTMGVGGAAGLSAAANIFVGMVEAPLLVRPYLQKMTRSELFLVMTCGMATIAGNMMVIYAQILGPVIPSALGHIMVASIISAPAAITIARIMVPEKGQATAGEMETGKRSGGAMGAITTGTADGLTLVLNVTAMLIVLVALVALGNALLSWIPDVAGAPITLQRTLGWLMAPLVWLMGVPWSEAVEAGGLMGMKTVLNEFIAYLSMAQLPEGTLSERTELIMTYAMCGFANLGSLGIMIGGMGAMAPERKEEIVSLGFRTIVSGTLATMMTGAVAGILG